MDHYIVSVSIDRIYTVKIQLSFRGESVTEKLLVYTVVTNP